MVLFAYEELSLLLENASEKSMSSMSVHGKCSKKVKIGDCKNRISELPDEILIHILSLLPAKYAFATRVLSPRWIDLCYLLPVLDFDFYNIGPPECSKCDRPFNYFKFVDVMLLLNKSPSISKFRLNGELENDSFCFQNSFAGWLKMLAKHLVKEIDVCISSTGFTARLPFDDFTSETLVVLRLGSDLQVNFPSLVLFPNLKILELSLMHPNLSKLQSFLLDCPVLEFLNLTLYLGVSEETGLAIFKPTLKTLKICLVEHQAQDCNYFICVMAPCLESLSFDDSLILCDFEGDLPTLSKANANIGQYYTRELQRLNADRIYKVFKAVSNVKSLSISYIELEALNFVDGVNFPIFKNLTHLLGRVRIRNGWTHMLNLLKSMPNIEILDLFIVAHHDNDTDDDDDAEGGNNPNGERLISIPLKEEFSCTLSLLKEINMHTFGGSSDEMNLVKYLLKNSEALQKVTIRCGYLISSVQDRMKFQEELLSCPKNSIICEVICS